MSEFFTGVTFPKQKVTPSYDAAIRRAVLPDSILSGCVLSYAGSTLSMGVGLLLGCGREFRHTAVQNWAVTGATSGFARLVLTIDTSRASTKDTFDQVIDSIEYASSLDGFLQLQQDDINESGTVYQMAVCVVSLGTGGITGIVRQLPKGESHFIRTVTLPADGWSAEAPYKQTVAVKDVIEDDAPHVGLIPGEDAEAEEEAWGCVSRGVTANGSITFTCNEEKPATDLALQIEVNR